MNTTNIRSSEAFAVGDISDGAIGTDGEIVQINIQNVRWTYRDVPCGRSHRSSDGWETSDLINTVTAIRRRAESAAAGEHQVAVNRLDHTEIVYARHDLLAERITAAQISFDCRCATRS